MREIDNNKLNSLHFNGIQKVAKDGDVTAEAPAVNEREEISDLSNLPAASLGKSQISQDSIESDLKFMGKNPALVSAINTAVDNYAKTHTEEETLRFIEKAHQEFVAK